MTDSHFKTIASNNSQPERRVVVSGGNLTATNRFTNARPPMGQTNTFDQNFDSSAPVNRSNTTAINSNRDLGGNMM